jgi:hypothetical protein
MDRIWSAAASTIHGSWWHGWSVSQPPMFAQLSDIKMDHVRSAAPGTIYSGWESWVVGGWSLGHDTKLRQMAVEQGVARYISPWRVAVELVEYVEADKQSRSQPLPRHFGTEPSWLAIVVGRRLHCVTSFQYRYSTSIFHIHIQHPYTPRAPRLPCHDRPLTRGLDNFFVFVVSPSQSPGCTWCQRSDTERTVFSLQEWESIRQAFDIFRANFGPDAHCH